MAANKPDELAQLLADALSRGDTDAVVDLYEPGATFVSQNGPTSGANAVRDAMGSFAAMKPTLSVSPRVVAEAGEIAVMYNDWSGSGEAPDGTAMQITGKAVEIARRQADGTWRYIYDDPNARG